MVGPRLNVWLGKSSEMLALGSVGYCCQTYPTQNEYEYELRDTEY